MWFSENMHTDSAPLWRVLSFFDSVEFSIRKGIIGEEDALTVFGRIFVWWHIVGTKGQGVPKKWRTDEPVADVEVQDRQDEGCEDA